MNNRLIIWGAGILGGLVGKLWTSGPVIGITQSEKRHELLRQSGIHPRTAFSPREIQPDDCLLLALPGYNRQRELLVKLRPFAPPQRAILISSTGYYGFPHGRITENTPPGEGNLCQAIAATEHDFHKWTGAGAILRLGGLYNAGRGPFAALIRKGMPSPKPADRPLPLIHYEDAATAVFNALHHPHPEHFYLGVTPPCPTRREFYDAACTRLHLPLPEFEPARRLPAAVWDVARWQQDLLPQPAFPNWQKGVFASQ